jgi:hypothetical protein
MWRSIKDFVMRVRNLSDREWWSPLEERAYRCERESRILIFRPWSF